MFVNILFTSFALVGVPLFVVFAAVSLYTYWSENPWFPDPSIGSDFWSQIKAQFSHFFAVNSEVVGVAYDLLKQDALVIIPIFTFGGYIMANTKAPQRLVHLFQALLGWLPGGVAIVAIITCAGFTALTGASGVTIIALGGLLLPMLKEQNYTDKFSIGLITCGGSLGLLFMPSLPVIVYGLTAPNLPGQGPILIDNIFIAGALPGLFLIFVLSVYSILKNLKSKSNTFKFDFGRLGKAIWEAKWEIPIPFIIIFGYHFGFFGLAEVACVTVFYILIVEIFILKEIKFFKDLPRIACDSMIMVGAILMILGIAQSLMQIMALNEVPELVKAFIREHVDSKLGFLILLNVILLIVGCLMDIFSAILVVVPIITPIALEYGVNPYHLAIIFLTNLEIGYMTPPVGINLFISSFRFNRSIFAVYKSAIPYVLILLVCLAVITYWEGLSLGLLRFFGKI